MNITLGFSPCPNDTFIFDAMIHKRIDTEGLNFIPYLGDVEDLNQKAFEATLDVTKLSYHAYAYLTDKYVLLHSGSALGNNCGPLLISHENRPDWQAVINHLSIAIPGKYTTANFLLGYAFPEAQNKTEVVFYDIEKQLLAKSFDAGVIIHENRFTYQQKGLVKWIDLGEYWEQSTGFPIPLGGIVVRRNFPADIQQKINRILRKSVEFAFANTAAVMPYVKANAQEMQEEVMMQHIDLYVNNYTIDLGENGQKAVLHLFEQAQKNKIIPHLPNTSLFI